MCIDPFIFTKCEMDTIVQSNKPFILVRPHLRQATTVELASLVSQESALVLEDSGHEKQGTVCIQIKMFKQSFLIQLRSRRQSQFT